MSRIALDPLVRFWAKADRSGGPDSCWRWTGAHSIKGYGYFGTPEGTAQAHRWIYQQLVGPIPPGLTIDHLCRVRDCMNPAHMEPVSRGENVLRGNGHSAQNARKAVCKRGHPFTGDNLYPKNRRRHCRACRAENDRQRKDRNNPNRLPPNAKRTHCPQGHPYAGDNLYLYTRPSGGINRACRTCRQDVGRRRRHGMIAGLECHGPIPGAG